MIRNTHTNYRVFHVDMDAFFAAIEQRNNPTLRGKPVIVGADPKFRGVVSTCSYEARQFGVHSAMPMAEAMKRCPTAIIVEGDPEAYLFASRQIKSILNRFTPKLEMISVDEAFLEIKGEGFEDIDFLRIARNLKAAIKKEVGVTCSVGIAPNKLIAKMASRMQKPDGLTMITEEEIESKIHPLPVDKMWGVGPVTTGILKERGVNTIGDLARVNIDKINRSKHETFVHLVERARGVDESDVLDEDSQADEKSISHEYTLPIDTADRELLNSLLLYLAEKVVIRMHKGNWFARTVGIRLRYGDFKTITRDKTLQQPSERLNEIFATVSELLSNQPIGRKKVRLIGVKVKNLIRSSEIDQIDLFLNREWEENIQLDSAINNLRAKFGNNIITRAGVMLLWNKK